MCANVLLMQPPYLTHVISPPIGLGYLASYLMQDGHQVELIDLNLVRHRKEEIIKAVGESQPDLVGISAMCTSIDTVRRITEIVKTTTSRPVVIGGAHASSLPEHTVRFSGADFVVVGEGELTIKELVNTLAAGGRYRDIQGLGYLDEGDFRLNARRPLIEDLDSIPFPAWELIPPRAYRIAPILSSAKATPIAPILTSRGCPYACTFCAAQTIWGKGFRYRSAGSVLDEIEMLMRDFGVREIFVSDDNFNMKAAHAFEFCEEVFRRKLEFPWACPNGLRVDSITPELLDAMKKAGCHLIGLGIESGNQAILDRAGKKLDLSIVRRVCENIDRVGIMAVGFFILGLPGETKETAEQTIAFAKSLKLKRAQFTILAPYPGCELFDDFVSEKNIEEIDWEFLDAYGRHVVQMASLTPEELDHYQKKAAREFYSRPGILLNTLTSQRLSTVAAFTRTKFFRGMTGRWKEEDLLR